MFKSTLTLMLVTWLAACQQSDQLRMARNQPDTDMGMYTPSQHELYDGRFRISGSNIYQIGTISDRSPWDHMDSEAQNVRPVEGEIEIDVNELTNSGVFRAQIQLPEGNYEVELDRFYEFSPCQDGGISAYLFEHGDAGCGDSNWPKSLLYVAGWGYGSASLNGVRLYENYEIHFMVTQGIRDRESLKVQLQPETGEAGAVNPAAQQIDFYIRSTARNENNHPGREVFDHFFAMEVTWK